MNVVVSNKYQALLMGLDIDVIKNLNGEFSVEELVSNFTNYYYNKMILDVTALKDYDKLSTYQMLSLEFDMSKIILLLDDSETVNEPSFISGLISMGIYNFTRNIDSIKFLIDNPNTYKDVAQFHQLNPVTPSVPEPEVVTNEKIVYVDRPVESFNKTRIVGIRNLTSGAGSTTLAYLMVKELDKSYSVCGLELNTRDFTFFNDKRLESINDVSLAQSITKNNDKDVIIVDLSNSTPDFEKQCSEVIYLIEPGIIKLNKLIRNNKMVFQTHKNDKIILNKSTLNSHDVSDFEFESGSHILFNIPYLDDRKDSHKVIEDLLIALGFNRLSGKGDKTSNIFSFFGKKNS